MKLNKKEQNGIESYVFFEDFACAAVTIQRKIYFGIGAYNTPDIPSQLQISRVINFIEFRMIKGSRIST